MEVVPVKNEEIKKEESRMTSAEAFVEGGIQDSCDDSCSICLEAFSYSDPSTVTSCRHEFHLQCVLEWCQRSSNCPMCWQPISLKDPASQELLDAVEQEKKYRLTPPRNTAIFHHPSLGDFELQHVQMGVSDHDLEDRIIQHLAAAAARGRTHHVSRREGSRSHSAANSHRQFMGFSPNREASIFNDSVPEIDSSTLTNSSTRRTEVLQQIPYVRGNQISSSSSGTSHDNRRFLGQSFLPNVDSAGSSSEFQSFSDSWKSRLNTISMKYKESISKNTRGWKEKLFSRSSSMADIGNEVKNAGIATVSRMMERLELRDNNRNAYASHENEVDYSATERRNHESRDSSNNSPSNGNNSAANSVSS